jgi:hypothetical protein
VGLVSAKRTALSLALGALFAGTAGLIPLAVSHGEVYDVEVRTVPRRTQTGKLSKEHPLGQGFRCEWDGLARIEVMLTPLGPIRGAELELSLRAEDSRGPVLRSVRTEPGYLPPSGEFVAFEFEPLPESAGREFWFELSVPGEAHWSPYSAWIRYHGQPGVETAWGNRVLQGTVLEGELEDHTTLPGGRKLWLKVPHPHLSAVAIAFETVRGGRAQLELWHADAAPDAPPLRSVILSGDAGTRGGYAFFAFEPITESRWKSYRYRLTMGEAARPVGFETGLSFRSFHGGTAAEAPLLGVTQGASLHTDRSLIFRALSAPAATEVLQRITARAGWQLWAGVLCWVLGAALAARFLLSR